MARPSEMPSIFYKTDFKILLKTEPSTQTRLRYMGLAHIQNGVSCEEVATMLFVSRRAVSSWIRRFKDGGLDGLKTQHGRGAKSKLSKDKEDEFRNMVIKQQASRKGGRLRGEDMRAMLKQNFGIECSLATVYGILKNVGMSWITSRSRHPKQDPAAQELFKKLRRYGYRCPHCGSRP